jgi:hypothetical protein
VRMCAVEVVDGLSLVDVFCFFSGGLFVPDPFDKVFEFLVPCASIKDLFDVVLGFIVDIDCGWRGNNLARKWVFMGGVEEGDVLDRVNPHTRRQLQFVGPWRDDLSNGEGAQATIVQFSVWPSGDDVLGI